MMKNLIQTKHVTLFIGVCDLLIHIGILFGILTSISNPNLLSDPVISDRPVEIIATTTTSQPVSSERKDNIYVHMISDSNKKYQTFSMEFPSMIEFKKHNLMLNSTDAFSNNRHRIPNKLHDKSVGILVTCSSCIITIMLIYGCLYNKASYLMPYFSIKVFQVVISSLSTLGFYSTLPDVKYHLKLTSYFPFKDLLLTYERHTLELIIYGFFLLTILVKLLVAINVWCCYRKLITLDIINDHETYTFRNVNSGYIAGLDMVLTENEKDNDFPRYGGVGMPPKYDDIVKTISPSQANNLDRVRHVNGNVNGDINLNLNAMSTLHASDSMESIQKPPAYVSVAYIEKK